MRNLNSFFQSIVQSTGILSALISLLSLMYIVLIHPFEGSVESINEALILAVVYSFSAGLAYFVSRNLINTDKKGLFTRKLKVASLFILSLTILGILIKLGHLWIVSSNDALIEIERNSFHECFRLSKFWSIVCVFVLIVLYLIDSKDRRSEISSVHLEYQEEDLPKQKYGALKITGRNKDDLFTCNSEDLIYVKGRGHYAQLVYINHGEVRNMIIRNSMSNLMTQLREQAEGKFCLAGRSLIININEIHNVDRTNKQVTLNRAFHVVDVPNHFINRLIKKGARKVKS